jgi:hypothetical protein
MAAAGGIELGQLASDPDHQPVSERDKAEQTHQDEEGEEAELPDTATARAVRPRGLPTGQNPRILAAAGI